MRVYVPATADLLRAWLGAGAVPADADRFVAPGEDEESEYAALMSAADASAALLGGPGRRVVVVAETAQEDAALPTSEVAAVHVDPDERPADADPDEDLAWYAPDEVGALLGW